MPTEKLNYQKGNQKKSNLKLLGKSGFKRLIYKSKEGNKKSIRCTDANNKKKCLKTKT